MSDDEIIAGCRSLIDRGVKPTVPEVLPLIEAYYTREGCGLGGAVHIVTEDDNWEQGHAEWCRDNALPYWDEVGFWIASLLCACSGTQRRKICHRHAYPDLGISRV